MSKSISKEAATAATSSPYTIAEHSERFEDWAKKKCKCPAGTLGNFPTHDHDCAVSLAVKATKRGCANLNNKFAKKVLAFGSPLTFTSQNDFDQWHEDRCKEILAEAKISGVVRNTKKESGMPLSYGIAAKLINVYLKARCIVGQFNPSDYIHPPIDSILLKKLAAENVGGLKKQWEKLGLWTEFCECEYKIVIILIRAALNITPLWTIEKYWKP